MVDAALLPAIKEAIKQNEIGNASPYVLSYAQRGQSGASFGIFQGDTAANATARATLQGIIQAAGLGAEMVGRVMAAVSQACPNGNPLSAGDSTAVNGALAAPAGRHAVDAMDATLLQVVLNSLDTSLAAAAAVGFSIDPEAQLYIALWINMTGAPNTLNRWIRGASTAVACPTGPVVSVADIKSYLQATKFFTDNPRNFKHLQDSVAAGAALLPSA